MVLNFNNKLLKKLDCIEEGERKEYVGCKIVEIEQSNH